MGTPAFAVPSLNALVKRGYDVVMVVTQKDKPQDRGKKVKPSPIKDYAEKACIQVLQPTRLTREQNMVQEIANVKPDLIVTCAFGQLLPKSVLEIPSLGTINVHASLLPELRGAAPIQWSIINGLKETGITTMFTNEGLDTGDMLLKETVEIPDDMTAGELHDMLSLLGAATLLKTLEKLTAKKLNPKKQDDTKATLAPRFMKDIGVINWNLPAWEIHNLVRGTDPWPSATTTYQENKIRVCRTESPGRPEKELLLEVQPNLDLPEGKIMEAELNWAFETGGAFPLQQNSLELIKPGTILSVDTQGLFVQTGSIPLCILEIQMPNSKRMTVAQYINGHKIEVGTVLGE